MAIDYKTAPDFTDAIKAVVRGFKSNSTETTGQAVLDLEGEVATVFVKDAQKHFVAALSIAMKNHPDPEGVFLQCLDMAKGTINPETALRGLMLERNNDALINRLLATCLSPAKKEKKGIKSRTVKISPSLINEIRRYLNDDYSTIGVLVWDLVADAEKTAKWVEAWIRLSSALLSTLKESEVKKFGSAVLGVYVSTIALAEKQHAAKLCQFVFVLIDKLGLPSQRQLEALNHSPISNRLNELGSLALGSKAINPKSDQFLLDPALPPTLKDAFREMLSEINKLVILNDELKSLDTGELFKQVANLESTAADLRSEITKRKSENGQLEQANIEKERLITEKNKQIGELEKETEELKAQNLRLSQSLNLTKSDFNNLEQRSELALVQVKHDIYLELDIKLKEQWVMTARMVDMVINGEREALHLANLWNQLDRILWNGIEKPDGGATVGSQ